MNRLIKFAQSRQGFILLLATVVAGLSVNLLSGLIQESLFPYIPKNILWGMLLIVVIAATAIGLRLSQSSKIIETLDADASSRLAELNQRMYQVSTNRLKASLIEQIQINIGIKTRPDETDHWQGRVQWMGDTHLTNPPHTVQEAFRLANGRLLILGQPGVGKSMSLLTLIQQLSHDKQTPELAATAPVPVSFDLAAWVASRKTLRAWIIERLRRDYGVTPAETSVFLKRLVLCLDGLDEVDAKWRSACVDAISTFLERETCAGVVVTCRIAVYDELPKKLNELTAVLVPELDDAQVESYLSMFGERLNVLRTALTSDSNLRQLAHVPLTLNIMTLTLLNAQAGEIPTSLSPDDLREQLLTRFRERMFRLPNRKTRFTSMHMTHYLVQIARWMMKSGERAFIIENLQPASLPNIFWRYAYLLISRLMTSFLLVIPAILMIASQGFVPYLVKRPSITTLLIPLLIMGILVATLDLVRYEIIGTQQRSKGQKRIYLVSLFVTSAAMAILVLYGVQTKILEGVGEDLAQAFVLAITFIFTVFGTRSFRRNYRSDIRITEKPAWSWKGASLGLIIGLLLATILIFLLPSYSAYDIGLTCLVLGVPASLLAGLRPAIHHKKANSTHFRWLVASLFSLLVGIGAILVIFVVAGLGAIGLAMDLTFDVKSMNDLFLPAGMGILISFIYGIPDAVQHYTLRALLTLASILPKRPLLLCEDAVAHLFMVRDGVAFRFYHEYLLEHFAHLPADSKSLSMP